MPPEGADDVERGSAARLGSVLESEVAQEHFALAQRREILR